MATIYTSEGKRYFQQEGRHWEIADEWLLKMLKGEGVTLGSDERGDVMELCCKDFKDDGAFKWTGEAWAYDIDENIGTTSKYVLVGMNYCPYCGTKLKPMSLDDIDWINRCLNSGMDPFGGS